MIGLDDLWKASKLAEQGEYDGAWKIVNEALYEDPNRTPALVLASFIAEKEGHFGQAYAFAKRVTQIAPTEGAGWINLGRCCDWMWRTDEADSAFRKALDVVPDEKSKALVYLNLSSIWAQQGKFAKAKDFAEKSLALNPDSTKAKHNLGMCQLAFGQWQDGWKNYSASVGTSANRLQVKYADEVEWKGETDGPVVIFGEQGIGDEINAASMFPDAIERAQRVIIETDPRLAGLWKRSFPEAKVYGTRGKRNVVWDEEDRSPKYSMSALQLGELFRQTPKDCPGTPFLVADPERVMMWNALWASKAKPVVGIAWTGGTRNTAQHTRQWKLEELKPLFDSVDAHWVSLEYKDAGNLAGTPIVQYPNGTLTKDYDDTAALVKSLTCIVSMQTSVIHLAGGLGVPCAVGLPHTSQWRYGMSGETMPFYSSVRLFRQKDGQTWSPVIKNISDWLKANVGYGWAK
jgi:tetratricopeptide (TPR) repeat protein